MVKCSFCDSEIETGTGKLFVKLDGRILNFCSNKCEKNLISLKRKPRNTKWTGEYHKIKKASKETDAKKEQKTKTKKSKK